MSQKNLNVDIVLNSKCMGIGDVAFAIDGSESVGQTNFELEKDFTIETIDSMAIGPDNFNIAAMVFSSSLTLTDQFDFNEFQEKQHLEGLIRDFFYIQEGTRTDLAIKRMQEMLDAAPRKSVPKIMVLITDGKSASPMKTIAEARLAKSKLTHIIVIGVGINSSDIPAIHEINAVASDPDMTLWITFDHLRFSSPDDLLDIVCQIATTTSTAAITTTTMKPIGIKMPRTSTTDKLTRRTRKGQRSIVTTDKPTRRTTKGQRLTAPEECRGCFIHDGIGYNPHLQLCYKFYQCINENYDVVKYIHTCPFGLFWSQKALSCMDPKVAECKKEPCQHNEHVGMRYKMEGVCSGFWECVNEEGKIFSKAMCCADGHMYEPISAICVPDSIGICNDDVCNIQKPTEQSLVCPYESVPEDVRMFRFSKWLGLEIVDLPCSLGTIFDASRCTCVNAYGKPVPAPEECNPEIHMKFDGNFMDEAGVNNEKTVSKVTLMNSNPSPAGGHYAHFNGSSFINLYSLANAYYGREVAIHFWMRPVWRIQDGPETIITNCLLNTESESNQCLHSDCNPSIQIELNKVSSRLNHRLVMEDGETHILKSDISNGEWVEVWYVYDGSKNRQFVTGTSLSQEDHVKTTGIVGQRQSGIVIGRPETNAFQNYYKGDIDEFETYRCIPEAATDALKNLK
ncbi:hypothetical protein ACJMK2_010952 [Sinanodonta woodiana]|uniref:Uncharacterized protein n=1 Tax=Sinanodonta woodiana TaxID=1069815 RepID=A0ABD3V3D0_SINWO